jgi:hypothetical protein
LRFGEIGVQVESERERALASTQATRERALRSFQARRMFSSNNRKRIIRLNDEFKNGKGNTRVGHQRLRTVGDGEDTSWK